MMSTLRTMNEKPLMIRGSGASLASGGKSHQPGGNAAGTNFSGADLLRMLRRRKWLIIISLFLFIVMGVAGYYVWKKYAPIYEASALLVVYPSKSTEMAGGGVRAVGQVPEALLATRAKFIKTEKVFEKALQLIRKTEWFEDLKNQDRDIMIELMSSVDVSVVPKTNFLKISMTGLNRDDITDIVNAVAISAEKITKSMHGTEREDVIKRLQELRMELIRKRDDQDRMIKTLTSREANEDMDTVKMKHALILREFYDSEAEYVSSLNAWELIKNRTDKEIAELPIVQEVVGADPAVNVLENRIMNIDFELKYLEKNFGEKHNSIKALKLRRETAKEAYKEKYLEAVDEAVAKIKDIREEELQRTKNRYTQLKDQLKEADTQLKELRAVRNSLDNAMRERLNAYNEIHDIEYRVMDLKLLMKGEQPVVLQHTARRPRTFKYPKLSLLVAVSVFLGAFFGVGLALLLELLDTTVKSSDDIARKVQLPVLGSIPHEDDVDEEIEDMRVAFLSNPNTIVCEAFRQVRTKLLFSGLASQHTSILITSPMPSDGRTTVCLGLGHHLALGGQRVLVVEANFRQPIYRRIFKDKCSKEGLSAVLQGQAEWKDTIFEVSPNFDILPAGSIPNNPTELLGSEKMTGLIAELASQYDIVLYDSSPCLVVSDTSVLCSQVDGVVLVMRAGVNSYSLGVRSKVMFEQLNAHTYGVVLNGARTKEGGLRKDYETFYEYSGGNKLPAMHS